MAELVIHESHTPETDDEHLLPGLRFCKVCSRLLWSERGVRARGAQQCEGPRSLVMRDGQLVVEAVGRG